MSQTSLLLESALVDRLASLLPDLTFHRGHSNDIQNELPRAIVTVAGGGGDLVKVAGIDALEVEIQILMSAGGVADLTGDPMPQLASFSDTIRGALQESELDALTTHLSISTPGLLFVGMEYEGHKEGRDAERALHGIVLTYKAWAGPGE